MSVRLMRSQEGSLPLTLLAVIVVAGLVSVLLTRVVAGERVARFDRNFTETLHVADGGLNQALFWFNAKGDTYRDTTPVGSIGASNTDTIDGVTYEWSATRTDTRTWEVVSRSEVPGQSGAFRSLVAQFEEKPRYFPGAFGDSLIALNGASSKVDSYDPACDTWTSDCRWGSTTVGDDYASTFGTGKGAIGSNETLDLSGNIDLAPDSAFLYDWAENPGEPLGDPNFGDRCIGTTRCTDYYVETVDDPLDFASPARMKFITEKFESGGGCADTDPVTNPRYAFGTDAKVGDSNKNNTFVLAPYDATISDPDTTSDTFQNYYCAEDLEFVSHIDLSTSADLDTPVVFFVKNLFKVPHPGTHVACHDLSGTISCDASDVRKVRPYSNRLQIYIAGLGSSDVGLKSQAMFAGIVYAPKTRCGGLGGSNAGADIYGVMMCGSMDNVGNWDFHFDEFLGNYGTSLFSIAYWQEDPDATP